MKNIQLREFDKIICEPNEKAPYYTADKKLFDELKQIIREFTPDSDSDDALSFMSLSFSRGVGDVITLKNYVGLIQTKSGNQIEILPKLYLGNERDEGFIRTKRIFLRMLRTLKDFPCKVFDSSNLKIDKMNLYEIFISAYLKEVFDLVKQGIRSDYVEKQANEHFYKGKLQIGEHIKSNIVHKERFFLEYDEYSVNSTENRIIKSTLLKLQKITTSEQNSKLIKQLLVSFELVEESHNHEGDLSKVSQSRNMKGYENILKWSRVFLLNKSFTTFAGDTNQRAILFPMEKVFESYVAKSVVKFFSKEGYKIKTQDHRFSLFVNQGEEREVFKLKPDIVLEKDGSVIVMDTKWKKITSNPYTNYDIKQDDIYQMYAYAKKYEAKCVYLLYPQNEDMPNHQIEFKSEDNVILKARFIDLENIEDSLSKIHLEIQ